MSGLMRLLILIVALFAFFVVLKGGQEVVVLGGVGFTVADREYVGSDGVVVKQPTMFFIDRDGRILEQIPLDMVGGAIYLSDDHVL